MFCENFINFNILKIAKSCKDWKKRDFGFSKCKFSSLLRKKLKLCNTVKTEFKRKLEYIHIYVYTYNTYITSSSFIWWAFILTLSSTCGGHSY